MKTFNILMQLFLSIFMTFNILKQKYQMATFFGVLLILNKSYQNQVFQLFHNQLINQYNISKYFMEL